LGCYDTLTISFRVCKCLGKLYNIIVAFEFSLILLHIIFYDKKVLFKTIMYILIQKYTKPYFWELWFNFPAFCIKITSVSNWRGLHFWIVFYDLISNVMVKYHLIYDYVFTLWFNCGIWIQLNFVAYYFLIQKCTF